MFFKSLSCLLVFLPFFYCREHLSQFECGAHGKFEYCIDDFPGCVIGCHCHPGYYFDTDTKVCEPNIKLTQSRRYNAEPTRVYVQEYFPTVGSPTVPTPTTTIDLTNDGSNDTHDLGDWLYNQFFKTVENHIINNTQPENVLTRRSQQKIPHKKPARITRKSSKSKRKKKSRGLKKKLLRITEDDSLFGSESESDDRSDDSSSSDSSGSDSDISSSDEIPSGGGRHNQKDHGHKKIILFNKRPKPPLPSFVFLPSMDTPFYPPMGLPQSPVMPMYPVAPIPPMMQYMPPILPPIVIPGDSKNATNGTNKSDVTEAAPSPVTSNPEPAATAAVEGEATAEPTSPPVLRHAKPKHRNQNLPVNTANEYANYRSRPGKFRHASKRDKLLKRMQQLRTRKLNIPDDYYDEAMPSVDITGDVIMSEETYVTPEMHRKAAEKLISQIPEVDFKYISELIHRASSNNSKKLASISNDRNNALQASEIKLQAAAARRANDPYKVEPANIAKRQDIKDRNADDAYYSNLGRQIASMIRNSEPRIVNRSIITQESVQFPEPFFPVLNKGNVLSRSFWERSIRSPPSKGDTFINAYNTKFSPEINLINLENEVNSHSRTANPLSLHDLENLFSAMEVAKSVMEPKPTRKDSESNTSLNVNLLPKLPPKVINISPKYSSVETTTNKANYSRFFQRLNNADRFEEWMFRIHRPSALSPTTNRSQEKGRKLLDFSIPQTKIKNNSDLEARDKELGVNPIFPKKHLYLQFLQNMPTMRNPKKRVESYNTPRSEIVNKERGNYFSDQHHYMFEEETYPLELSNYVRMKPYVTKKPSYFHQESRPFDYFN